jgi:cyclopropane-fatty-acyl-phospholipid synthase
MTARAIVHRLLALTRGGVLELREPGGEVTRFGELDPDDPLHAVLEIHSRAFYRRLLRGSLGLAEAHMDGLWTSPDLVAVVRLGARNGEALDRPRRWLRPVIGPARAVARARNTITRSRRQISAHYDLGNELFALFLDERMMYSSAIFPRADATLEEGRCTRSRPSAARSRSARRITCSRSAPAGVRWPCTRRLATAAGSRRRRSLASSTTAP